MSELHRHLVVCPICSIDDLIMFVHRQEKYDKEPVHENIGKAEIIVSKNRNGGCGSVHVGYDGPTFRFYEIEGWV